MSYIDNPTPDSTNTGTVTSVSGGVGIENIPDPITGAGSVNLNINELTLESTLALGDLFPFNDISVGTTIASQRKTTLGDIAAFIATTTTAGHTIQEDSVALTQRANLNFQDGLIATDDAGNNQTDINLDYADTVSSLLTSGASSVGTSLQVAREDHIHAIPALLDTNARVTVRENSGADVGTRRRLNFIEGANVTFTIADDAGDEEIDITINAASPGTGTVTSVAGGTGITNSPEPITTTGTVDLDIFSLATAAISAGDFIPFVFAAGAIADQRKITFANLTAGLQPLDAALTALSALAGTGYVVQTAPDTFVVRTFTSSTGIALTNPDGVAGATNIAPANDLAALEAMAGTGIVVRTAAETYAQRSIAVIDTATVNLTVTNADGVAGNPTLQADVIAAGLAGLVAINVEEDNIFVGAATTLDFTEPDATIVTFGAGEADINLAGYARLPGRAGGQTLIGGLATAESLTLASNALFDDFVYFGNAHMSAYYELADRFGMGILPIVSGIRLQVHDAHLLLSTSTAAATQLRFGEPSGGLEYVGLRAPALAATTLYDLPNAFPTVNNQVLGSTTAGVMSWLTAATLAGTLTGLVGINIEEDNVSLGTATTLDFAEPDEANWITIAANEAEFNMGRYARLLGRLGGQTLIGGNTASTEHLNLDANNTAFAIASTGRIRFLERAVFPDSWTFSASSADHGFITVPPTTILTLAGGANIFPGYWHEPTVNWSSAQILSAMPAFYARPILRPTAAVADIATFLSGFHSQPRYRPSVTGASTGEIAGYLAFPQVNPDAGITATVSDLAAFHSWPSLFADAVSATGVVTRVTHFKATNPTIAGTVTEHLGIDIPALSGGTLVLSARIAGTAPLRIAPPTRFGSSTLSATGGSVVHVDGGYTLKRTETPGTGNYVALLTDYLIEFTALTAARVLTLPTVAAAGAGKWYYIVKTSGAFTLSIDPDGTEQINSLGAGVAFVVAAGTTFRVTMVYCNGTQWIAT